jgi:hypothetical protein
MIGCVEKSILDPLIYERAFLQDKSKPGNEVQEKIRELT